MFPNVNGALLANGQAKTLHTIHPEPLITALNDVKDEDTPVLHRTLKHIAIPLGWAHFVRLFQVWNTVWSFCTVTADTQSA